MTNEEIKTYITAHTPEATFDETGEWLTILVESNHLKPLAAVLPIAKMPTVPAGTSGNCQLLAATACICCTKFHEPE